jgi:hypothetical protein
MHPRKAGATLRAHLPRRVPWEPWSVLVPLVALQWLGVAIIARRATHNGWLFATDPSATWSYTTAWIFGGGHIPATYVGYGLPLLYAPVTWISGSNLFAALHVILPFQVLVLLPLGALGAYILGARSAGRLIGYLSALIWTLGPLASMHYFVGPVWLDQILPMIAGLTALPYLLAMLTLVLAGVLVLRALDEGRLVDAAAAGVAAGFTIALKPTNVVFLAAPVVAFVVARHFRQLGAFAAALVPCLITYVLWREKGLGHFGSVSQALLIPGPTHFARANINFDFIVLQQLSWSPRLLEWIAVAGFVALLKRSPVKALFFATWLGAYILALGGSRVTDATGVAFWHLMLPAFPAYCVLMASLPLLWPRSERRLAEPFEYEPRRLVPLAVPALVALVVPLVAVAAVPALHKTNVAAEFQSANQFVPIGRALKPRAIASQRRVTLSWQAPKLPAKVFYAVYRTPHDALHCSDGPGAARCAFNVPPIAVTRATTFSETKRPGTFAYRVAALANYVEGDTSTGLATSLSPPVDVLVR